MLSRERLYPRTLCFADGNEKKNRDDAAKKVRIGQALNQDSTFHNVHQKAPPGHPAAPGHERTLAPASGGTPESMPDAPIAL